MGRRREKLEKEIVKQDKALKKAERRLLLSEDVAYDLSSMWAIVEDEKGKLRNLQEEVNTISRHLLAEEKTVSLLEQTQRELFDLAHVAILGGSGSFSVDLGNDRDTVLANLIKKIPSKDEVDEYRLRLKLSIASLVERIVLDWSSGIYSIHLPDGSSIDGEVWQTKHGYHYTFLENDQGRIVPYRLIREGQYVPA